MNFSFWPFLWFGLPGRLLIGEGPPAEPRHEVFPEISPILLCSVLGI